MMRPYFQSRHIKACFDDHDGDDVITLIIPKRIDDFPETLPVVTKQAVTKMHLNGRIQTTTLVLSRAVVCHPVSLSTK